MNETRIADTENRTDSLLILRNVTVRLYGKTILDNISMDIREGEHWAIVGETGSGKTSLLKMLAGQMVVSSGKFNTGNLSASNSSDSAEQWYSKVAFAGLKHGFRSTDGVTGFYFQQRFNAGDAGEIITVKNYLENLINQYVPEKEDLSHLNEYLQLERLAEKSLIQLSSGETRRVLIAAALIKRPKLLLLDMPLTGLDTEGKQAFEKLLLYLTSRQISVVMTASPSQIPQTIAYVGMLRDGALISVTPRSDPADKPLSGIVEQVLDFKLVHDLLFRHRSHNFTTIIKLKNVNISYGEVAVLNNLNWEVKSGEKWALTGENGAGKSTLLSLINADHPQAYANDIILFDRKRGSGESIWDIKKNTGFVSAEFYQYFPVDQTCLQIIESGLFDTMGLFRMSSPVHIKPAMEWMKLLQISGYANSLFSRVPAGIQRIVLLIRALIKNPPLLLLDEPAQGLDEMQQSFLKEIVNEICNSPDITLIYVTHNPSELPAGIRNNIKLSRAAPALISKPEESIDSFSNSD